MDYPTIAAISTPLGPGGIGIIRLSGPDALTILEKLFVASTATIGSAKASRFSFSSHRIYHGYVREPGSDHIIDEVLAFYMKGPASYTREDIVEIQCHSGYVVLDRILGAVIDAGAELAKPGEFTQRAFLNGRIDLSQAEAVIDLINAPCETAATIAVKQAAGELRETIGQLIRQVNELQGKCEAMIEFDDSDAAFASANLHEIRDGLLHSLLPQISNLIKRQKSCSIYSEGVLMAIAGVPNVGKSSLLNQLAEKEIAIVSEIPGTTRDIIREYLSINGIPVTLCDTAGLHDAKDPIECIGIRKAHDHIDQAEILLFVVDGTRELGPFEEQFLANYNKKKIIVVINKIDLASIDSREILKGRLSNFDLIEVSAKAGCGISELRQLIFNALVGNQHPKPINGATPNLRHRKILEKIERLICFEMKPQGMEPELMAEMLAQVRSMLEQITGVASKEELYDYIFSQFCIGK